MTATGQLRSVVLDVPDVDRAGDFYAELTGWTVVERESDWVTVRTSGGPDLALQLAPEHTAPKWPGQDLPQQFHLDLQVDGHQAAAERAVALGATRLAEGASWITLADPAGHPFDLCQSDGVDPAAMTLYAVTVDAPDTSALAAFYAALTGMEVTYDGPEGALTSGAGGNVMFQKVAEYAPPRWPDPAYPQQVHLDVAVTDLDAAQARALELGATKLPGDGQNFRVFADPAGHPFCLTL